MPRLLSVVESPTHPDCSAAYRALGLEVETVTSIRKAIAAVKRRPPDVVVAEFFYGYGNNYAGVNLGNLDTLLATLRSKAPQARTVVMVDKGERRWAEQLATLYPVARILEQPVDCAGLGAAVEAVLP